MHVAILQTGQTNSAMPPEFHDYPALFIDLFEADPRSNAFKFTAVPVIDNVFPETIHSFDAYIITGSRHGVYDDLPWIPVLMDFIREAHAAAKPLIGVCFGHQLIAHALGGHAAKSSKGWGLGVSEVALFDQPEWMQADDSIRLIHIHQDQVEQLPPSATLIGSNDFCPNAMFYIDDNVFCVQGHPEFTIDYIAALMKTRIDLLGEETVEQALKTLDKGHDGQTFAGWAISFLEHCQKRQAAA